MRPLRLDGIESARLDGYFFHAERENYWRVAIATSGYEKRSSYWTNCIVNKGLRGWLSSVRILGFRDYKDRLSRPENDAFYASQSIHVEQMARDDGATFLEHLRSIVAAERKNASGVPLEFHIDYSCMPRSWYCELPRLLYSVLEKSERACLWYSKGIYPPVQYPTAGVDDFRIFFGQPSLDPRRRTHLFGLGFDKIRSQAIWSVLEPKNLVCFLAERGADPDYVRKVRTDNADILAASSFTFSVPIDDFVLAFSRLRAVVLDLRLQGDVIIVPDGPKQLVLASSLIPLTLDQEGIVCFHVRRRKDADIQIVDVEGTQMPTGFVMYGGM